MSSTSFVDQTTVITSSWLNDVNNNTYNHFIDSSSVANNITLNFTAPITSIFLGRPIRFTAAHTNTGACTVTLVGLTSLPIPGTSVYNIQNAAGGSLSGGEIVSGNEYVITLTITNTFQLISVPANVSSGGGTASPSITQIPDFVLSPTGPSVDTSTTPNRSYKFLSDTTPGGWNTGAGRMTLDFQFTASNYFSLNPGGHFAVICRQDPDTWLTVFRGGGVAIGNTYQIAEMPSQHPTVVLESWVWGDGPNGRTNWLYPNSVSPPAETLVDSTLYRVIVETTVNELGRRYMRYHLYKWITQGTSNWDNQWKQIHDTGDVLDSSDAYSDWTKSALGFIETFSAVRSGWSISFQNIFVTWNEMGSVNTDSSTRLSTLGGTMTGDLSFSGTKRLIKLSYGDSSPAQVTTFTATENNSPASVFVQPSGTANFSSLTASNASSNTVVGLMSVQAGASEHQLVSYSAGGYATCNISVSIQGVKIATFSPTSAQVNGNLTINGSKRLIQLPINDGTPATVTTFQAAENNSTTSLFAQPTGTGSIATFTVSNSSSNSSYSSVSFQARVGEHRIEVLGAGGYAQQNLGVILDGSRSCTFQQGGILLPSASVKLGTTDTSLNVSNVSGSNISALLSSTLNMDGYLAAGVISNYFNTAGDKGGALEDILRIHFARLADLIKILQDRKVI